MTKRVRERVDREKEKKSFKTGLWRLTRTSFLEEEERVLSGNDLHFFYRKMDDDAKNEQMNERHLLIQFLRDCRPIKLGARSF